MKLKSFFVRVALAQFALSLGCVSSDEGRSYDEFVEDYRAALDARAFQGPDVAMTTDMASPDVRPPDPDMPPTVCSEPGSVPVNVEFVNATGRSGQLVWINPSCERLDYAELPDTQPYVQPTFVGHVWQLVDVSTRQRLGEVKIEAETQTQHRFEPAP